MSKKHWMCLPDSWKPLSSLHWENMRENSKCARRVLQSNTFTCALSTKECGEDLLVDVSEVLFREMAFFKLIKKPMRFAMT